MMKVHVRLSGFLPFFILLTLPLYANSSATHSATYSGSHPPAEAPIEKKIPVTEGVSVKLLFVIDGSSEDQKFAAPVGVFCDKYNDEIYVADTGNNRVDVFAADGQPRFHMDSVQGLKTPLDVVVDPEGQIYVSQMGVNYLRILDFRGSFLANIYAPNAASFMPGRMCLDAEGRLYVVDRKEAKVLVYDAAGDFQFQFGGRGEGEGKFRLICGVVVDSAGLIYVADSKQRPIQIFDENGRFLTSIGRNGPGVEDFSFPGGMCIDEEDRIWIVDSFRHQVKVLKTDGSLLFQFGA